MQKVIKLVSVLASFLAFAVCVSAARQAPVVAVTGGSVRGATLPDGGAVFKGIPYAQPPLAELRWKPPAPIKLWTSVRDAVRFGRTCAMNPIWGMPKVVNEIGRAHV